MRCKFCNASNAPFRCDAFIGKDRYVCDSCYELNYATPAQRHSSGSSPAQGSVCPVANAVALQVLKRAEVGLKKYGVNAARQDLTTHQWLQHLQEELLDAAVYIERLKQEGTLTTRISDRRHEGQEDPDQRPPT